MNQRAWFGPEIAVSTSSRLVETALQIAYSRRATAPLPHSKQYRTVLLPYCARRADTGDTRALASPLRMARQRGSRQGSHARAPAHHSDHSTWRGSEEADKAHMRALPLTSPTTPHDRYWFLQTSLPMHRKPLLQPLPQSRTVPAPCIASLDELKPRPLYSVPELCGGRVEGDEQLAHRD